MKTIIAGSRTITDPSILRRAISESGFKITEVVCGGATGVDELGRVWANAEQVPVRLFPADWARHLKQAGVFRNIEMVEYAEAAIILWDGESRGARDMAERAIKKGVPFYMKTILPEGWR
jgi:hypothetical protein